jgi:hypothetical protein
MKTPFCTSMPQLNPLFKKHQELGKAGGGIMDYDPMDKIIDSYRQPEVQTSNGLEKVILEEVVPVRVNGKTQYSFVYNVEGKTVVVPYRH